MDKWNIKNKLNPTISWILIILLDLLFVFLNKSTFDDGDSILHYLQAHQAADTPHLFLDMWAKPLFIILAWPLASFGWWGIKLFNSACILLSTYFAFKIFEHLGLKKWWALPLCFGAPAYFLVQSSGLTEPLFTVFLTAIVYLEFKNKTGLALLLLSFLPFVRAEGWIIMLMFGTYLVFAKKWHKLPLMLIGTLVFGIVGTIFLGDFLFMFHENPYNGIEEKFGNGDIFHYVIQLPYIVGLPIFLLIVLGAIRGIQLLITNNMDLKEAFLVYGFCAGYLVSQSIFWRFGLFHSFGMTRVLIVIIPLLSIIAYKGLDWISSSLKSKYTKLFHIFFLLFLFIFPFTRNKMGFKLEKSYNLNENQKLILKTSNWIINNGFSTNPIYCNAYYFPMVLHKHVEKESECSDFALLHTSKPKIGSLLIWDSYFAVTDAEVSDTFIEKNFDVQLLKEFINEKDPKKYTVKIYEAL